MNRRVAAWGMLAACTALGAVGLWMLFGMLGAGVPTPGRPDYTPADQRENLMAGAVIGAIVGLLLMPLILRFGPRGPKE
jgi:hypothetical protein